MVYLLNRLRNTTNKRWQEALMRYANKLLILAVTASLVSAGLIQQARAQTAAVNLDPTFDQDGKRTTDFFGQNDAANAVAIQPNGKIVVAGYSGIDYNFTLARYNSNGTLDRSFGGDGKVITRFYSDISPGEVLGSVARAVALQPDGKIVAAGSVSGEDAGGPSFAFARYNPDGQLDTSFDGDGKLMTIFGVSFSEANDIVVQPNGKILVAGSIGPGSDFALVRYNSNGSLDTSFDSDGMLVENIFGRGEFLSAVALQPDGKIVAAGYAIDADSPHPDGFAVRRYNPNGSRDATFGSNGSVLTHFVNQRARAMAVAVQPDNKIVAAGWAGEYVTNFALARYNTDGTLDTSFDSDGMLTTNFFCDYFTFASGLVLQPDGKIVVAGPAKATNESSDFAVARYSLQETPATPALLSLTLSDTNVGGCQSLTGAVTLNAPAPPGGTTVSLKDADASVSVPAAVTVPAGETTACFQISSTPVSAAKGVLLKAQLGSVTKRASLIVRPIGVQSMWLSSTIVRETETVTGNVRLECPAPPGGVLVTLSSNGPSVAFPTTSQLFIPAGEMTGTFTVRAGEVTVTRPVIIRAALNGTAGAFRLSVENN